jgi:hypothetical protein
MVSHAGRTALGRAAGIDIGRLCLEAGAPLGKGHRRRRAARARPNNMFATILHFFSSALLKVVTAPTSFIILNR